MATGDSGTTIFGDQKTLEITLEGVLVCPMFYNPFGRPI